MLIGSFLNIDDAVCKMYNISIFFLILTSSIKKKRDYGGKSTKKLYFLFVVGVAGKVFEKHIYPDQKSRNISKHIYGETYYSYY